MNREKGAKRKQEGVHGGGYTPVDVSIYSRDEFKPLYELKTKVKEKKG